MSERSAPNTGYGRTPVFPDILTAPVVLGRLGLDLVMTSTIALARLSQIAVQSADAGISKYIELTETEMKRNRQRESVKVE